MVSFEKRFSIQHHHKICIPSDIHTLNVECCCSYEPLMYSGRLFTVFSYNSICLSIIFNLVIYDLKSFWFVAYLKSISYSIKHTKYEIVVINKKIPFFCVYYRMQRFHYGLLLIFELRRVFRYSTSSCESKNLLVFPLSLHLLPLFIRGNHMWNNWSVSVLGACNHMCG